MGLMKGIYMKYKKELVDYSFYTGSLSWRSNNRELKKEYESKCLLL